MISNDIFDNISDIKQEDTLLCDQSLTGKWEDYVPTSENFHDSLKVEKVGQSIADTFYKECLGALDVRRYDYNYSDQRWFQKMDIDCTIELEDKSLDVFWLNISEKFRQYDCGDMCLELWSDFEKKQEGWVMQGLLSEGPDYYLYVTPKYFYKVSINTYFENMIKKIIKEWDWNRINQKIKDDIIYDHNGSIPISVGGHEATLIKSWTKFNEERKWFGVCVCIPWKTLFNDYLIDINMYDRKCNKLVINKEY